MTKRMVVLTLTLTVAVLALASLATADVPQVINYQGRLLDSSGDPVANGNYLLKFIIYGSTTGSDSLWSSGFRGVTVTDGLFNYLLGDSTALPDTLFSSDTTRYLGITVGADPELSPRTRITSVAYAYQALRADTADFAWTIADDSVTTSKLANNAVSSAKIANDAVTTQKIADYAVTQQKIANDAVITQKIMDNAVTTQKIADYAVTQQKIANDAVITQKIMDNAVTTQKIGSDAVTTQKLANNAVTSTKIADGTIQFGDIGQNGAANGQIMKWNGMAWAAANDSIGPGSRNGWVDDGTVVRLDSINDSVGIGTTTPQGKLDVVGDLFVSDKATIGPLQTNTGTNAFVAGAGSNVSGNYAAINGGQSNNASGDWDAIGGGSGNSTSNFYSTVAGGLNNGASGTSAAVGGGEDNRANGPANTIAGGRNNNTNQDASTIGGGENNGANMDWATVGGGRDNRAAANDATVGGGQNNRANGSANTIAGGRNNSTNFDASTIGGGENNNIDVYYATIGGGLDNTIVPAGGWSVICGGQRNNIDGMESVISGGTDNTIHATLSAITGGSQNFINPMAQHTMIFGSQVDANVPFQVQFFEAGNIGALKINRDDLDGPALGPITVGTVLGAGDGNGAFLSWGGVWTNASSREFKENFQPVDGKELLEKVSSMQIESWNYKSSDERHIGPVAEDFAAAFDVGPMNPDGTRHNKHLAATDVAGVALIGVKELYRITQELDEKTQEIEQLKTEMAQLQSLVETLLAQQRGSKGGSDKLAIGK